MQRAGVDAIGLGKSYLGPASLREEVDHPCLNRRPTLEMGHRAGHDLDPPTVRHPLDRADPYPDRSSVGPSEATGIDDAAGSYPSPTSRRIAAAKRSMSSSVVSKEHIQRTSRRAGSQS
jgi:hypothetical protein